jgi:hypothetical protein
MTHRNRLVPALITLAVLMVASALYAAMCVECTRYTVPDPTGGPGTECFSCIWGSGERAQCADGPGTGGCTTECLTRDRDGCSL